MISSYFTSELLGTNRAPSFRPTFTSPIGMLTFTFVFPLRRSVIRTRSIRGSGADADVVPGLAPLLSAASRFAPSSGVTLPSCIICRIRLRSSAVDIRLFLPCCRVIGCARLPDHMNQRALGPKIVGAQVFCGAFVGCRVLGHQRLARSGEFAQQVS